MNRIEVNFNRCLPAPSRGYEIKWRVAGSGDAYMDAGKFFNSPAVFYDPVNPAGTLYEGYVRSDCSGIFGTPVYWNSTEGGGVTDNSSCGTTIFQESVEPTYQDLGFFILHVDGAASVDLNWSTFDRPNKFTLYDNDVLVESTGWRGVATYAGPWGETLSTTETGIITFVPVLGHEYKVKIEVGPGDPENLISDSFNLSIICSL